MTRYCKGPVSFFFRTSPSLTPLPYSEVGHLLRFICSVVFWGGRDMSNTTGMCGECSQWMAHNGFATAQVECPSQICTAQSPGCSMWSPSQVGPAFHAVPRTMSLRFSGALQGYRPRWAVHFVPCPGLSSSGDRVLCEHTVQCGPCILFTCLVQLLTFPGALRENSPECVMCLL